MTDAPRASERREFSKEELDYIDRHLPELREQTRQGRFLGFSLATGFVLGLLAYLLGYFLRSSLSDEPFAFLADLVYALGLALWTGVVVAFFIEVVPEIKRRQVQRYLDAYEATRAGARQPTRRLDRTGR